MGGFGVIRCGGNDCVDRKFHLSILSQKGKGLSVSENLDFPTSFDESQGVYGGSCGGWLYFHGLKGQIVIWNLTAKESKVFPPPPRFDPYDLWKFVFSGMGYDAKFGDYKLIRYYVEIHETADVDGRLVFAGRTNHFEVYSFKRGFWRDIRGPDTSCHFTNTSGVYVNATGRCYWPASYNLGSLGGKEIKLRLQVAKKGTAPYNQFEHVVSFDFATERFHQFPLPATTVGVFGLDASYTLVECRGSLGALVYLNPELQDYDRGSSSFPFEMSMELHLWNLEKKSWKLLYKIAQLPDVTRPILGLKDNRFLFLESKLSDVRSQLMVYDLYAKTGEKLDIYDYPGCMYGFSYAESTDPPLPNSRRKKSTKVKKRSSRKGKCRR